MKKLAKISVPKTLQIVITSFGIPLLLSSGSAQTADSCSAMHGWVGIKPATKQEYKMQYDTLHDFIMSCAKDSDSYEAFSVMDGAVEEYAPNDTTRYDTYREWLISVLYLNPIQPVYFCACLESISGTYQYGKYAIPNARLAVLTYLRNITSCDNAGVERDIKNYIDSRHQTWLLHKQFGDTAAEDTVLPPLDSIGLGILLDHESVSSGSSMSSAKNLHAFVLTPNPFVNETNLQFTLSRMTYITMAVYDELGRLVWGDGKGSSFEAGTHTVTLDGKNLPHGTLYARISTGFGEVRTVKLIHE
ncbi:MAG: T9SS type A sorting domain-containing protein [Bacteroidota bacterium]|nr:T9SS type A sorting domain-containing protein [Bacteroidota bacterium]MDP4231513.1 T9SS type A sorting domain-containing protein [Bacteroidota bacterium]MDP4236225.1 T9SS type A sorting domain-containing protein [Bacteroidota bacterium]